VKYLRVWLEQRNAAYVLATRRNDILVTVAGSAAATFKSSFGYHPILAFCDKNSPLFRPMRGLKRLRSAAVITAGHAFVPNLRRGHYELATDVPPQHRLTAAFTELALAI
jgi:transposase, IS6 family